MAATVLIREKNTAGETATGVDDVVVLVPSSNISVQRNQLPRIVDANVEMV